MKRFLVYTTLLLSVVLVSMTANSQSYPVQANLYVMAPYSQTYSDYYADGQQRMFVNILLNDMSQGQLDVVLRFTISGNGLKLTSKPAATVKPITILSGKLCRIEGSELAQYLKPEQMQVDGRKADEFNKSGRLPEGYYEVKVEVIEFYRKVHISAPAFTTMWIMQPEAPVWTMPQNGVRLDATNPQFVMFGWMLTNSTSLLQNVKYTFSIYAKPDNMNPDVVARTTTPLYSETLTQTMLVYGPDKPLLELGGTYVCRIKAEDADGNVTFKNDGYSETLVFRYGQTCDPPKQVTITDVTKKGATVNWVESGNYSGYDIEVRETTGGKSSDWYVWNIDKQVHSYDLKQLSVSSSYECRVAAVCGQRSNGIRSQYSDVVSFKTYDAGNKNYTCGDLVEANKHEDRVPYPYLEEGDVIEANGFLFAIESISKASEGVFSGQCSWYIDLWGVSILCDFKDISINRHQQLIAGKIEACRDKVKAKAFTRLQSAAYMPIGTQVPSTFSAEKVIKMEETVDSIRIVNGQTLIYVAGKEPQKVDATDDVFVQSPDGNYYAVEGGNVYPKPSNLDSEGNRQLSYTQQLVATFGYDDAMGSHPGVDSYTDAKAPFAAQYTQYQLHSNDAYATWMAVEKYRTSMAKVTVSGGDRNAIQLRNNGQSMVRTDATDADALYMPISADGLYEAYYTTQDNKGKDVEVVAGQLNVTSYERNNINVCLVGVNGEFYQYSVSELSSYLNQVFGQAVTSINLTTASIDVDKFNGTLSARESGALSAYNSDMKKLIRKVKKLSDYNSETYYIMLVERSDDQTLGGFMPVNSNFGFVFAKANSGKEQLNRTIAHELAHGAFRLWHTFSSENIYVAQRGSTKNLMDYNGTNSELYKYQWDYIHNPEEGIVKWMVDDEESESANPFGFDFYDYFFSQIGNELSAMADAVTGTISSWFKSQKKEEKPVIPELSDNQKAIIDILTGIHNAEKNYTIKQRGSIYSGNVEIDGTEYKIALHIQPDLEFRLAINGYVTLSKLSYTKDEHDDYTLLHFKQSDDSDKIALTIQVEKSKADDLQKYIGGYTYNPDEIVIYITRTHTGEHSTTGTLVTDDGTINGYTVELPRGTDSDCKTSCEDNSIPYDCHCIIEGTYNFEITTDSKKAYYNNQSLRIFSDYKFKTVPNERDGILLHRGQDDANGWSQGCVLAMPNKPIDNLSYDNRKQGGKDVRKNTEQQSLDFVLSIVSWVKRREVEISSRHPEWNKVTHKIIITRK